MESRSIKGKRHYVFDDVNEYISHFSSSEDTKNPRRNWRNSKEGEWVFSDDGRIVQLLKVKDMISHPNDRKNYKYARGWVRTIVGTFLNKDDVLMDTDFDKHPDRYTFSGKKTSQSKRLKERRIPTKRERLFATSIATGTDAVNAYKQVFGDTKDSNARAKAVALLKQERVMKEIEKTVTDIAKNLGINHEYILSNLKCLAENSIDENIQLQSTKELGKAIGTLGGTIVKQKEVGIFGMLQEFTPEQIESARRPSLEPSKEVSNAE